MRNVSRFFGLFVLAASVGAGACGGSSDRARESPPGPVSFAPEPSSEGAVVFLRGRSDGERVSVDVIGQGIADLHGAAFRLHWDDGALAFLEARPGAPWSKQAVLLAKEGSPGELAVVWSEKGEGSGHDATSPAVLGTLVFRAKSSSGTAFSFRTERSTIVDHLGKPATVSWRAGNVVPR